MTAATLEAAPEVLRRRMVVRGLVQGVGFRPFVYRLARDLALRGWVCNSGEGVDMELQGPALALQTFLARLRREAPPLSRIVSVEQFAIPTTKSSQPFFIAPSQSAASRSTVIPDASVCAECLSELFDPLDRRYRYPFINCVGCGPRFTITRALPFDRVNTSMASFAQCPACQKEYESPGERRFHAQANACPRCGPQLSFHNGEGAALPVSDVIASTITAIRDGHIVALKGLGGFHLVCDARNAEAIAHLRVRKGRDGQVLRRAEHDAWVQRS